MPRHLAAVQSLADRYRDPLVAFFARRVFDTAEAEDLTQEVFLRLLGRANIATIENAEAFIFCVALNLLRDYSRRAKVRKLSLRQFGERQTTCDYATPERVAIAEETLGEIARALDQVGLRSSAIFLHHRIDHMEYREIAQASGVSVSTIEKHMIKVLARLARFQAVPV